jgi:hypothetical protein
VEFVQHLEQHHFSRKIGIADADRKRKVYGIAVRYVNHSRIRLKLPLENNKLKKRACF